MYEARLNTAVAPARIAAGNGTSKLLPEVSPKIKVPVKKILKITKAMRSVISQIRRYQNGEMVFIGVMVAPLSQLVGNASALAHYRMLLLRASRQELLEWFKAAA